MNLRNCNLIFNTKMFKTCFLLIEAREIIQWNKNSTLIQRQLELWIQSVISLDTFCFKYIFNLHKNSMWSKWLYFMKEIILEKKIFRNWLFSLFEMKDIHIVDICIFIYVYLKHNHGGVNKQNIKIKFLKCNFY